MFSYVRIGLFSLALMVSSIASHASADDVSDDTRRVVVGYFNAWTSNDINGALTLLADDLQFSGPLGDYSGSAAFRPALVKFASMTKWARVIGLVVEGDRAALLYECELLQPKGVLKISAFFHVKNGKISTYDTQLDATGFHKLQALKSGSSN